jgi:hypothetical protein
LTRGRKVLTNRYRVLADCGHATHGVAGSTPLRYCVTSASSPASSTTVHPKTEAGRSSTNRKPIAAPTPPTPSTCAPTPRARRAMRRFQHAARRSPQQVAHPARGRARRHPRPTPTEDQLDTPEITSHQFRQQQRRQLNSYHAVCQHLSVRDVAERVMTVAPVQRSTRAGAVPAGVPHGLIITYSNYRCRCKDCRRANNQFHKELIARYTSEGGRGRHGTDYRYRTGCRCAECRAAHAAEDRQWRASRQVIE